MGQSRRELFGKASTTKLSVFFLFSISNLTTIATGIAAAVPATPGPILDESLLYPSSDGGGGGTLGTGPGMEEYYVFIEEDYDLIENHDPQRGFLFVMEGIVLTAISLGGKI